MPPMVLEKKIQRVAQADITQEMFHSQYCHPGTPLIVTGCMTDGPWSACATMADFCTALGDDAEAGCMVSETVTQVPNDEHHCKDFPEELSVREVLELLALRREAHAGDDEDRASVIYTKFGLNSCQDLLGRFGFHSFLSSGPMEPVEHPMLLRPGGFYCWAFIGERGTGSKTHVDVMSSEAWLVVVSGAKQWAMVHPADRHLVLDSEGNFANLFEIDHDRYPQAHRARIYTFVQRSGDAVFVPSDAPHCVRNLEFSVSITFNFMTQAGVGKWGRMINRMIGKPAPRAVDVAIFSDDGRLRVDVHSEVENLPKLPTTDFAARSYLDLLQAALSRLGSVFASGGRAADCVGVPLGYDFCFSDDRVLLFYRMPAEIFRRVFVGEVLRGVGLSVDDLGESGLASMAPSHLFATASSHFGRIPLFPPLRVLLGLPMYFERAFSYVSLPSIVSAKRKLPRGEWHPQSVWHYSRTKWADPSHAGADGSSTNKGTASGKEWCKTYLFYNSPDVVGPVSLFPIELDRTLQPLSAVAAAGDGNGAVGEETTLEAAPPPPFDPHLEELEWNLDELMAAPLGLVDLGDDLVKTVTTNIVLSARYQDELLHAAVAHGLSPADIMECGIEKVMIFAMWFCCRPSIVGFTYSHTFSTVEEPNTVCLTASAASTTLRRVVHSDAASSLTSLLALLYDDLPNDGSTRDGSSKTAQARTLVRDGKIPREVLEAVFAIKEAEVIGDGDDDGKPPPQTVNQEVVAELKEGLESFLVA